MGRQTLRKKRTQSSTVSDFGGSAAEKEFQRREQLAPSSIPSRGARMVDTAPYKSGTHPSHWSLCEGLMASEKQAQEDQERSPNRGHHCKRWARAKVTTRSGAAATPLNASRRWLCKAAYCYAKRSAAASRGAPTRRDLGFQGLEEKQIFP